MKKKEYIGVIRHMGTDDLYGRITEISAGCKKIEVFEFEGRYFSGSIVPTIKAYLQENPAKSFFVWLIDAGLEVRQNKADQ